VVLTQERVQIESDNIHSAQLSKKSPYLWDFNSSNENIVESFMPYWTKKNNQIEAIKASNPKLSLNLSGSVINSLHHQQLQLSSKKKLHGFVTIEFKTELDDDFYYYSPRIQLSGKSQIIDLQTTWRGQNKDKSQIIKAPWGTSSQKINSLVLHFENPWKELSIDSVFLPFIEKEISHKSFNVSCDGIVEYNNKISLLDFNHFKLNEFCLFSSNYLWLKQHLYQRYPGSTLTMKNKSSWSNINPHRVNDSFTSILPINIILYVFIGIILAILIKIRNSLNLKPEIKVEQVWYQWLIKKLLMQKLLPYHFVFSYSAILVPTLFLFVVMMYFKFPSLTTFKELPMYFLWAVIQQFVVGYILAERIFYNRIQNKLIASLFAGLVFAIFHMPSVTLMLATFVGGTCWALAWLWFKRFIPLAISHALLALMFYYVTPEQYLHSAKVLQWFWK
jgi:hypothetical protein